jgi:methionyl-tRNA formyltransferase
MRIVFLGTPKFAIPSLRKLLEHSHTVCAVFTQPDRPVGRGHKLQAGPVKELALARGIPLYQPEKIRLEENRPIFEELGADFIVVAAYGQILPGWLLQAAKFAPVNVHASLLPSYRGASPIAWAVINGDAVSGVTTMLMRDKLDAGPILLHQEIPIPLTRTTGELTEDLAEIGADLLIRTIDSWGTITPMEQDETRVSWAPRITKASAQISWQKPALQIHNQVRGMNPWPVAWSEFRGERLQIWRTDAGTDPSGLLGNPGTFLGLSQNAALVECGDRSVLRLLEVQLPAKSRVTGRQFASGVRLNPGDTIG